MDKKRLEKKRDLIVKAYQTKTNQDVKQAYMSDVINITLIQILTDSVYEMYINMKKHIESTYGVRQNAKQVHNYRKLKQHLDNINKCFAKITDFNTSMFYTEEIKEGDVTNSDLLSDVLLEISDYNINYFKQFVRVLVSLNRQNFVDSNVSEDSLTFDKLWDFLTKYDSDTPIAKPTNDGVYDAGLKFEQYKESKDER